MREWRFIFEPSYSRVEAFTTQMREEFKVVIMDNPEAVAEQVDAILITSVDGRSHLEQFTRIAPFRKPVFIDKPFAASVKDALEYSNRRC
ncbi:Gfo/Idh/MocA family oxidoreductase [Paenibacillus sp. TAF58]